VREDHATGTHCNNHQLRADACGGNQWSNDAACGDSRNGRGTQGDTQHRRDRPRHQDWGDVGVMHHGGDVLVHAAINQNLFERTATTDDQQHHGNDFDRGGQGIVNLIHGTATVQTEGEQRNQDRNQGRHDRIAEELSYAEHRMTFRQNHFTDGTQSHQHHRHQRGPDADGKAWHFCFGEGFCAVQTFRDWLVDTFQATCKDRTGQNNGWDRQDSTKQQGFTHISMEDGGDSGRARVRRQEAVRHGQRSGHWHAHIQQGGMLAEAAMVKTSGSISTKPTS